MPFFGRQQKDPCEDEEDDTAYIVIICIQGTLLLVILFRFFYRKVFKRNRNHRESMILRQHNQPATVSAIYNPRNSHVVFEPPVHLRQFPETENTRNRMRGIQPMGLPEPATGHSVIESMFPTRGQTTDEESGLGPSLKASTATNIQDGTAENILLPVEEWVHRFNRYESNVRDLFVPTERCIKKTVSDKLVVMCAHLVDDTGDHLILDNTGISLRIPSGALLPGQKEMISLVLNWDLSDNPPMEISQALVSPVIYCGPHGLKLQKPCELVYRHCAFDPGDIKIMVSETEFTHQKEWKVLCESHEEQGMCVVTQEECRVNLQHFSLLTSIQCRPPEDPGKKWLQLAAFVCPLQADIDHYQVRVYFLNKTPCALEWAIQEEANYGGNKCCPEKVFLFNGQGEDMILSVEYKSEGWNLVGGCAEERISFQSIWHGHCPYAAICFKRSRQAARSNEINIHFKAYQDRRDNEYERLVVHMTQEHRTERNRVSSSCINPEHVNINITSQAVTIGLPEPRDDLLQSPGRGFPEDLKQSLKLFLDPRCTFGNNWRALASAVGIESIEYLESLQYASPTMKVLQYMEHKGETLLKLYNILERMGRKDASEQVLKYMCREEEHARQNNTSTSVKEIG